MHEDGFKILTVFSPYSSWSSWWNRSTWKN